MSSSSVQLETARRLHAAGELDEAEAIYRRLLADSPQNAELCHLLGALERQTGRTAAAITRLQQALALAGSDATVYFNLAGAYEDAGQLDLAEGAYREALRLTPDFLEANVQLGTLLRRSGRLHEAAQHFQIAREHDARFVPAHIGLGIVRQKLGDPRAAAEAYQQALRLAPAHPQARFNLATVLHQMGESVQAIELYRDVLQSSPDDARAHQNLAHVLVEVDELVEAEAHYLRAIELLPGDAALRLQLGSLYYRQRRYADAAMHGRQAIALMPDHAAAHVQLGLAESHTLGPAAGVRRLARAAQLEPRNLLRQVAACCAGQTVFRDVGEIDEYRTRLAQRLAELSRSEAKLHPADIPSSFCKPPFCLPYHGRDDRTLKEQFASLFAAHVPPWRGEMRRHSRLPRIGLVVTAGHEGVFLRGMSGILQHSQMGRLRATVVCHASGLKRLRQTLVTERVDFLVLPGDFPQAVERLRAAQFDVLHFWEIGTDSVNYFLPLFRCAPVQVTSWGWPTTSGMAAVDYFLSSELLESDASDRHYSERLVRLTTLPTCYARSPMVHEHPSRAELGLPGSSPVYLCPQNLAKFHPDFDDLVGEILRTDRRGVFAAIASREEHVTAAVRDRLRSRLPDVATRILFLPRVSSEHFPRLLRSADVLLDTPHYGGGANTTAEVLGQALPLVSLRGEFHRGRWGAACYARLAMPVGMIDTPRDYVATAVRLANDPPWRQAWSRQIADSNHLLFDDQDAVRETVDFWERAAAEARDRVACT
ncbi:MAG: tetratricopeptide repeat protein [Pirellulales bacterium]|nr:tetratricopeptide repeat protein [Pirellulales bacterium]